MSSAAATSSAQLTPTVEQWLPVPWLGPCTGLHKDVARAVAVE